MRKGETILGQTLTTPFAMIIVFILMILFVSISASISVNNSKDNFAYDFHSSYMALDGKLVSVGQVISMGCSDGKFYVLDYKLKDALSNHFMKEYPGYSFVLVNGYGAFSIGEGYKIHAKYNAFDRLIIEKEGTKVSVSDFNIEFPEGDYDSYDSYRCDLKKIQILVRRDL